MNRIKKMYYDSRIGMSISNPILAGTNFILLAYNFTWFSSLPFWLFVLIASVTITGATIWLGNLFRTNQFSTDQTLRYERNPEIIYNMLLFLKAHQMYLPKDTDVWKLFDERIKHHERLLMKNELG